MKWTHILFFGLMILISCQQKKKNSTTNTNTYSGCIGDLYFAPGCPGYVTPGTTGSTTGTTIIGTPINPYPYFPTLPVNSNWGVQYPAGIPNGECSSSYAPEGVDFTPYETRKATMTIVGKTWYNPTDPVAPFYMNTSSLLKSVSGARQLFSTDSILKVRFKPLPQPESSSSSPYCYNRQSGSPIAGYTKLKFSVDLVGMKADGSLSTEPLGTHTVGVNSCTPAIDLSSFASIYPGGIFLIVQAVKGNQGTWPSNYDQVGFQDGTVYSDIRSSDCWAMDIEIAADGTKIFD